MSCPVVVDGEAPTPGRRSRVPRAVVPVWAALALLTGALVLLAPAPAGAQFLRVSPGPLARAHSHLEGLSNCTKCHEKGAGIPDFKCLDCHDHANLKRRVQAGKGFHASAIVRGKPCISCHSDHKGTAFDIFGWGKVGGKTKFNHDLTGFALRGKHAVTGCEKCHTQRRPRTGNNVFLGLQQTCQACHRDRHDTVRPQFKKCERCHGFDVFKPPRIDMRFQHNSETSYQLVGKHAGVACVKCHQGAKFRPMDHAKCTDCHANPHKNFFATRQCTKCHDERRPWKQSVFDHATTRFPLTGQHRRISCYKCHVNEQFTLPKTECKNCHADAHKGRFQAFQCETCHNTQTFKQQTFAHNQRTRFVLGGKHARARCRDCHRGKSPAQFEKFPLAVTTECRGCHRHVNAHDGQFKFRQCTQCHDKVTTLTERGLKTSIQQPTGETPRPGSKRGGGGFRPDDWRKFHGPGTPWPTTNGGHFKVRHQCEKCHQLNAKGTSRQFEGTARNCFACHARNDIHKGSLGVSCESCHNIPGLWKPVQSFDHDKTRFPLRGKHAQVSCEQCHPNKVYKPTPLACSGCHGSRPDPLPTPSPVRGDATPSGGSHTWLTPAEIEQIYPEAVPAGAVEITATETVVIALPWWQGIRDGAAADAAAPVVRRIPWELLLAAGPGADNRVFAGTAPAIAPPPPQPFLRPGLAPAPSTRLAQVRNVGRGRARTVEPHDGVLGTQCDKCHGETSWRDIRKFVHDTFTSYPLTGKHKQVRCDNKGCHPDTRHFKPRPKECIGCHVDVHKGLYGNKCEVCHTTDSFKNVKAFHDTGAFILGGVHDSMPCSRCHGDFSRKLAGLGPLCGTCHRQDDIHHNAFGNRCSDCHQQWAWAPARFRHSEVGCDLVGVHRTLPCRDCHKAGNFGGLSDQCVSCHLKDWYRAGHFGAKFGLNCADCHKPTSFALAKNGKTAGGTARPSVCR